ncbi:MAG: LytR/AlgR family response regulator transcription factor [Gammaproteobacteria bacterium]
MNDLIRTLIVDDEPLNRAELRYLLSQHADVTIVGEAESVGGARTAIARHRPELVLLDIRIDSRPGGLDLAAWIEGHAPGTHVVFVTAHPEHALEAFDHHPAHFLVKPIDDGKLVEALAWVRRIARRLESAPERLAIRYHELDRSGETIRLTAYLRPADILYIQKNKLSNSVDVVLTDGECLTGVRQSLEHFEARIGNGGFFRIHSGCLVNLNHLWRLRPRPGEQDSYHLTLPGRVKLPVSRLRLGRLRDLLQASHPQSDAET